MREKITALYKKAMRRRDWYFMRQYSWRMRIVRYPLSTLWYAASDRFWYMIVAIKRSPFLKMHTFWGQTLIAPFPDYRALKHHGLLDARELPVEEYLVNHLTDKDIFFDVGANIGFYTALAQALGARAYAFEPTPRTFHILSTNVPSATRINEALADKEGNLSFSDFGPEWAGTNAIASAGEGNITVHATTLDAYCREQGVYPTCIKMDVEKAELLVLEGAREVFLNHRPILIVETEDLRITELLASWGYDAYHFDRTAAGTVMHYHYGEEIRSANMLFLPANHQARP